MARAASVAAPVVPRPRTAQDANLALETMPVWEALNPWLLTERMQSRLLAAMEALLSDPALSEASDSVRLAAVVLTAKTSLTKGSKRYLTASVTAGELGRWLGVRATTVRHEVRPRLQRGAAFSEEVKDEPAPGAKNGRTAGISWTVEALRLAQLGGDKDNPLALTLPELVTLLRLLEVLFAPGWSNTPAGRLAWREGHGAATDRLALLMAVLTCRPDGRIRLCAGAVDRRGRPAATAARWLAIGQEPGSRGSAEGERVLARLEFSGEVVRTQGARGERLVIRAVAEAWQELKEAKRAAGSAPVRRVKEPARKRSEAPERAGDAGGATAWGDQIRVPKASSQVSPFKSADVPAGAFASLHSLHACGGASGKESSVGFCFSGSSVRGDQSCGVCACGREDQPLDDESVAASAAVENGETSPLRGEKHNPKSPSPKPRSQPAVGRQPLVPVPPEELQQALAPVIALWQRLDRRPARRLVTTATERELRSIDRLLSIENPAAPGAAAMILADRLEGRLALQGGPEQVTDPVGWMLRRGLPSRGCGEAGCADGWLLHRHRPCDRCQDRIEDRRDLRRLAAAAAAAELPTDAPAAARHTAYQRHLQAHAGEVIAREAERAAVAREVAEERRFTAEEARLRAEFVSAWPCRICGTLRSGGLCEDCQPHEATTARHLARATAAACRAAEANSDLPDHVLDQIAADALEDLQERMRRAAATSLAAPGLVASITAELAADEYEAANPPASGQDTNGIANEGHHHVAGR